jgi:hypothetical protein
MVVVERALGLREQRAQHDLLVRDREDAVEITRHEGADRALHDLLRHQRISPA